MVIPSVRECRHSARKEPTRRLGLGLSGEGASRAASSTNPSQFYKQHGWETEQWENHCEPGSSREPPQHTNPQISTCLMKTNRPESSMSFGNECLMSNFSSSKILTEKPAKNTLYCHLPADRIAGPCHTGFIFISTVTGPGALTEARNILSNSSYWISLQDWTLLISRSFCLTSERLMGVDWHCFTSSFIPNTWELLWAAAPMSS